MMNDSVREEVGASITKRAPVKMGTHDTGSPKPLPPRPVAFATPAVMRSQTADLVAPATSPTLVGFQSETTSVPDWRLQMQNAVQMRRGGHAGISDPGIQFPTNGGAALKAEPARLPDLVPDISDTRVANAMRRIEQSRKAFLEPAPTPAKPAIARSFPPRPFGLVESIPGAQARNVVSRAQPVERPRLVVPSSPPAEKKRDTNKLPRLVEDNSPREIEEITDRVTDPAVLHTEFGEVKRIRIKAETDEFVGEIADDDIDAIEDLAPFSMRFGAGLFDLIIGAFASMLLLSPIAFAQGNWFTTTGLLIFAATCAVVMFGYMTACLGFYGKTMGMRLFSLELVDAVENEYPTLYQAAVNSSIFIVSLPLGGASFVTLFFNEEKRAVHDIVSGTILVKEF
ncbi:MAG: RDD family protein [Pyrinomonadaceae bacterium]